MQPLSFWFPVKRFSSEDYNFIHKGFIVYEVIKMIFKKVNIMSVHLIARNKFEKTEL